MNEEYEIPRSFDPFAEDFGGKGSKSDIHIRIQQRNGKKCLTTVSGLSEKYEKILKRMKKKLCCNGNVVEDKELGKIIQLQGDQRNSVADYLVKSAGIEEDQIKIHGF